VAPDARPDDQSKGLIVRAPLRRHEHLLESKVGFGTRRLTGRSRALTQQVVSFCSDCTIDAFAAELRKSWPARRYQNYLLLCFSSRAVRAIIFSTLRRVIPVTIESSSQAHPQALPGRPAIGRAHGSFRLQTGRPNGRPNVSA
jgi:hypothetical protein